MLNITFQEEPGFLPVQRSSEWIGVSHNGNSDCVIRYSSYEGFFASLLGRPAGQYSGIVIDGYSWDKVPIPRSRYVFIFVSDEVRINSTVG